MKVSKGSVLYIINIHTEGAILSIFHKEGLNIYFII